MTAPALALAGLARARLRVRWHRALAGAATGTGALATLAMVGFHLDRALAFDARARGLWLALMIATILVTVALAGVAPFLRRVPDSTLAIWAERRYPVLGERLLSAVELAADPVAGASPALADAVMRDAVRTAADLDLACAVPRRQLRIPTAFALVAIVALTAHILLAPDAFRTWISRALFPAADIPIWAAAHIRVEPGDATMARGDAATLRVIVRGYLPDTAQVAMRSGSGPWERRVLSDGADRDGARVFVLSLPAVLDGFEYYARAHDGRSNTYRIRVEDRPLVQGASVTLTYPAYMGKPPATRQGSGADILAPVGTIADIRVDANKELAVATMTAPDGERTDWRVEGASASGRLRVMRDGFLTVALKDTRGFGSRPDARYAVRSIPDRAPSVRITVPARDLERSPIGSVRIEGFATDDYGVGSMSLVANSPGRTAATPLKLADGSAPTVRSAAILNLAPLRLKDGDVVRYHLEARDRDDVSGPHTGRSAEYRIRIISLTEMQERADADTKREIEALRRLAAQQKTVEDILRKAGDTPSAARVAADRQRSVAQQTAALRSQVAQATERMRENGLLSDQDTADRASLSAALEQLARATMPQAAAAMDAAAQPSSARNAALERASTEARDIRRELERLANSSGPAASASELARAAAQLAREQAAMADVSEARADFQDSMGGRPGDLPQLAARQAKLQEQTRALAARLDAAARSGSDAPAVRQAQRDFSGADVPSKQAEAGRQLSAGRPADAAKLQRESAAALRRLASSLLSGQQSANDPAAYESRAEALRKAADQLGDLANRQRAIQQAADRNLSPEESARTASDERALQSALNGVMPALASAPAAEDTARRASASMGKAADALASNNPKQASQPARQGTRELLQAAMEANEAASLFERQADALQAQREIEALARDQRALRDRTQSAEKQAGKDDKLIRERSEALARDQEQIIGRTHKSLESVDSGTLKWIGGQATRRMESARSGLWQRDMGPTTRRYQTQAAQTLERLAASLEQQRLAAAMQIEAGTRGSPESQMADVSGDVRAVREMQAQIRAETGQIEDRRAQRPDRVLSEQEKRDLSGLGDAEREAQDRLREAADRTREAVGDAEEMRGISQQMTPIREALYRQDSSRANLERQAAIIAALDRVLDQNREELASSQKRLAPASSGQQQRQTARSTPGTGNAPLVQAAPPSFRAPDPARFRFGGLSAREQQLLQSGKLDKVPPEYRDLVSRYYRALSERR
ncbi:MAG: hypothetical protein GX446_14170 [Chthonomonadales bacterium]|nr:hypothetical protein [Chthonomonadales bacterium]